MKPIKILFASFCYWLALSTQVWAMAARPNMDPNAPPPPAWMSWFPVVFMVAVFYFLLIRPQMKQRKEHQVMLDSIKKGDRIVTQGGLIATVLNVSPSIVDIKINEETKAQIKRSAVAEIFRDTPKEKEADKTPVLVK